jgi:hypothetical protein
MSFGQVNGGLGEGDAGPPDSAGRPCEHPATASPMIRTEGTRSREFKFLSRTDRRASPDTTVSPSQLPLLPACVEAMIQELGDVRRGVGSKAVEVGVVVVPDDHDRLADDGGALDGPPVAAVAGVCAVVAQDVELAGRDAVGMLVACDRRA